MQPSAPIRKTGAELAPGELVLATDSSTLGQVIGSNGDLRIKVGNDTQLVDPAKAYSVVAKQEFTLLPGLGGLDWLNDVRLGEPGAKIQFTVKANLNDEGRLYDVLHTGWGHGVRVNFDGDLDSLKRSTRAALLREEHTARKWPSEPGSARALNTAERIRRLEALVKLLDGIEVLKEPAEVAQAASY